MKTHHNNIELYKEYNGKTYHWCEVHREHDPLWLIYKPENCRGLKNKQKEYEYRKKKSDNDSNNKNQDDKKPSWNYVMLDTIFHEESDSE